MVDLIFIGDEERRKWYGLMMTQFFVDMDQFVAVVDGAEVLTTFVAAY